ncbi:helix-turn-helix domain-containing protein [Virgibacillus sediminis]|uniref:Helix-turn-helix domain-containing protein n=1 Tax=Virgibacillus sediminis TaxID=202260 RepID=A0ABV7A2B4_9BACI
MGITQETISRRLSQFQMNGWINQKGQREIKWLDIEALSAVSEE